MRSRFQREILLHDPRAANQYAFPASGRIRRNLLERTLDGRDYYGDAFQALHLDGTEKILNIGTGDGWDEVRLVKEFNHDGEIVGIDIPVEGSDFQDNFRVAKDMLSSSGKTNVSFEIGNAMALKYEDNSFDVVIWAHSGYHFTDVEQAISETKRVLKPKGKLLNLTNGDINKHGHHEVIKAIKAELGVYHHEPFSATFDLYTSRRVLRNLVGPQITPITQKSLYRVDHSNLPNFIASIDSYRSTVPREVVSDWTVVRQRVIDDMVMPYIEYSDGFLDYVYRGGGVYENAVGRHILQVYLGRSALRKIKKQPLAADSTLTE